MPEKKSPLSSSESGDSGPGRDRPDAAAGNSGMFSLLGTASTMGLHMVSGPIVGGVLGWLADNWLDSWPIGAAVGLLLGVAAGFRNVWVDARYLIRHQENAPEGGRAAKNGEGNAADKAEGSATPSGADAPSRRPLHAPSSRNKHSGSERP